MVGAGIIVTTVGGGIALVLGLVSLLGVNNPVETYMKRYLNLPKPIVRELKPLGYDRVMDANEKALIDEIYFLPHNFQISKKNIIVFKNDR